MPETNLFRPPRRWGMVYQLTVVLLLAAAAALGVTAVALTASSVGYILFLLPAALAVVVGPVLLYAAYALWSASYLLERDGIHLQWGLRSEDIPMDEVLWVREQAAFSERLPLPWLYWPGMLLGRRSLRDGTPVEFFAARTHKMLLIATSAKVYAISPAHADEFIHAFQQLAELGTMAPVTARSVYPAFLVSRLGRDRWAIWLLLLGLGLGLGLLAWVGLSVGTRATITWQFPSEKPSEPVPAVRLFLLPVLNLFFFTVNTLLGLFFYRREETQVGAYLLWCVSMLTSILFLGAAFFILQG